MQWADLQGRPQIVALFYSSCHVACPITVEKLKQIESTLSKDLQAQVGIVLVTFDPMADTADVLHSFRRSQQLSNRWTLLRGTDASTRGLTGWLGVAFERQRFRLTHSNAITLLDAHGRIVFQRTGLHDPIDDFMKAVASITATPSTAAP